MPTKRFEMPNGFTFRTNSARRYIVVAWVAGLSKWVTEYRTDTLSVALARWRQCAPIYAAVNVVDTTTGEVIR